jgi:hypothetical protein
MQGHDLLGKVSQSSHPRHLQSMEMAACCKKPLAGERGIPRQSLMDHAATSPAVVEITRLVEP